MPTIHSVKTPTEYEHLVAQSATRAVFLLKHSTRCPVSWWASSEYDTFAAGAGDEVECFRVLVVEDRALSQEIERRTGVTHESPQVILFRAGKPVWNASHGAITRQALTAALAESTAS